MPMIKMSCPVCARAGQRTSEATVIKSEDGQVYRNKTVLNHEGPLNTKAAVYQEIYLRCQDPECKDLNGQPTRWVVSVSFVRMISPPKPQDFIDNLRKMTNCNLPKALQRQFLECYDNGYLLSDLVVSPSSEVETPNE